MLIACIRIQTRLGLARHWRGKCPMECMKISIPRILSAFALTGALTASFAIAPTALRAEEHSDSVTYHDKGHNDDHQWNGQEDKAYGMYQHQNHQKSVEFSKRNEKQQQQYWNWRHNHSDTVLKIDVH
jgi:hypothetical protein